MPPQEDNLSAAIKTVRLLGVYDSTLKQRVCKGMLKFLRAQCSFRDLLRINELVDTVRVTSKSSDLLEALELGSKLIYQKRLIMLCLIRLNETINFFFSTSDSFFLSNIEMFAYFSAEIAILLSAEVEVQILVGHILLKICRTAFHIFDNKTRIFDFIVAMFTKYLCNKDIVLLYSKLLSRICTSSVNNSLYIGNIILQDVFITNFLVQYKNDANILDCFSQFVHQVIHNCPSNQIRLCSHSIAAVLISILNESPTNYKSCVLCRIIMTIAKGSESISVFFVPSFCQVYINVLQHNFEIQSWKIFNYVTYILFVLCNNQDEMKLNFLDTSLTQIVCKVVSWLRKQEKNDNLYLLFSHFLNLVSIFYKMNCYLDQLKRIGGDSVVSSVNKFISSTGQHS